MGQEIIKLRPGTFENDLWTQNIDLSDRPKGVYFLVIEEEGVREVRKIVLQ